jgi:DNA polymerase-1
MRRIIIDADGLIYKFASAMELELPSEEEDESGVPMYISLVVRPFEVLEAFWMEIETITEEWQADEALITITDSARNFRLAIDPTYKGNRKHTRKPLAVKTIRAHLAKSGDVYFKPGLEADDTCGILMGLKRYRRDEMILWSPDKDLDGIPGVHARIDDPGAVYFVTRAEADYWHLVQTVAGDQVDGYPGISGIGIKSAGDYFNKHGATWCSCVELASMAGMPYADLLVQARLAKMLEPDLYDFKTNTPILWNPPEDWRCHCAEDTE